MERLWSLWYARILTQAHTSTHSHASFFFLYAVIVISSVFISTCACTFVSAPVSCLPLALSSLSHTLTQHTTHTHTHTRHALTAEIMQRPDWRGRASADSRVCFYLLNGLRAELWCGSLFATVSGNRDKSGRGVLAYRYCTGSVPHRYVKFTTL